MADDSPLLTIAEAAAKLGISERSLYRLLKSDNYAARTVTERRQTVTGKRLSTFLPAALFAEIAAAEIEKPTAANADNVDRGTAAEHRQNADRTPASPAPVNVHAEAEGTMPAVVYQTRIAALEEQLLDLKADKERLYNLLEQSQANLAREQSLRLLAAPQAVDMAADPAAEAEETAGKKNAQKKDPQHVRETDPIQAVDGGGNAEQPETQEWLNSGLGSPHSAAAIPLDRLDVPKAEDSTETKKLSLWERLWKRY